MDILFATDVAGRYVRAYGMNGTISKVERQNQQSPYHMNYDIDATNSIIENILGEEKKRAKDMLNKHIGTYKKLLNYAVENNCINVEKFLEICNADKLNFVQKEINDKLIYSYDNKLKAFLCN